MEMGGRAVAQNYTPAKHPANAFKAAVRLAAAGSVTLHGPLFVSIKFIFPRPKGMRWKNKPMPRYAKTSKPDADNLAKAVLDALNGIVWDDDAQVFDLRIIKVVAGGDEQPRTEITVQECEQP
jgi:Holliday junction resolvase RusA-like endonuclease